MVSKDSSVNGLKHDGSAHQLLNVREFCIYEPHIILRINIDYFSTCFMYGRD